MRSSVANRPKRVDNQLTIDIEDFNKKKFDGKLSFTQASAFYVKEKHSIEEELARIRKSTGRSGGRLI